MADVVAVDFGKEDREHARRFARLMGLLEAHEEDVLRNPGKHLKLAHDEISRLRRSIDGIRRAYRRSTGPVITNHETPIHEMRVETIIVSQREWAALQEMRRSIETLTE